jgi:hypothetical protein
MVGKLPLSIVLSNTKIYIEILGYLYLSMNSTNANAIISFCILLKNPLKKINKKHMKGSDIYGLFTMDNRSNDNIMVTRIYP